VNFIGKNKVQILEAKAQRKLKGGSAIIIDDLISV